MRKSTLQTILAKARFIDWIRNLPKKKEEVKEIKVPHVSGAKGRVMWGAPKGSMRKIGFE